MFFSVIFFTQTSGKHTPGSRFTMTLWTSGQTLFASTSLYTSLIQRLPI